MYARKNSLSCCTVQNILIIPIIILFSIFFLLSTKSGLNNRDSTFCYAKSAIIARSYYPGSVFRRREKVTTSKIFTEMTKDDTEKRQLLKSRVEMKISLSQVRQASENLGKRSRK